MPDFSASTCSRLRLQCCLSYEGYHFLFGNTPFKEPSLTLLFLFFLKLFDNPCKSIPSTEAPAPPQEHKLLALALCCAHGLPVSTSHCLSPNAWHSSQTFFRQHLRAPPQRFCEPPRLRSPMSATILSRRNTYEHPPSGSRNHQGCTRHAHSFRFSVLSSRHQRPMQKHWPYAHNFHAPGDVAGRCLELAGQPLQEGLFMPASAGWPPHLLAGYRSIFVVRPLHSNILRPASMRHTL